MGPPLKKKVSPPRIAEFWKAFDQGQRRRTEQRAQAIQKARRIDSGRRFDIQFPREPVAVSPSVMGTVRKFMSRRRLKEYIQAVNGINQWGSKQTFQHFVFHPFQVLAVDRANNRALERVYPAPSIGRVRHGISTLYSAHFQRKIDAKKIPLERLNNQLGLAIDEIYQKLSNHLFTDRHPYNLLVLDYDLQQQKPVIMLIDPLD